MLRSSSSGAGASSPPVRRPPWRLRRRFSNGIPNLMLETLPFLFHLGLLGSLSYYAFALNRDVPNESLWTGLATFILGQIVLNWAQFLRHRSVVQVSPRNFPGYQHRFPSMTGSEGDRPRPPTPPEKLARDAKHYRKQWRECESCDMHVPNASHHCGHCGHCINRLDHHCYFLGHCVGRNNQRFFIVFLFYAALGAGLGAHNLYDGAMRHYRDPMTWAGAPYYALPFTILMWLADRAAGFEVFYVSLIDFGLGACFSCLFLLALSVRSVCTGLTPHEERKKQKSLSSSMTVMRLNDDSDADSDDGGGEDRVGFCQRFRDVFGSMGWLHFLLPVVPLGGKPKFEMGYRRIITYNNDYILNGTVHTSQNDLDYDEHAGLLEDV